jgi:membrane protease YdiL (CAAX protease family)
MLVNAAASALGNVMLLAGLPLLVYWAYQRWRHGRGFAEVARRAGLRLGELRVLGYCAAFAAVMVGALVIWPPPLEPWLGEGSAFRSFEGLGFGPIAVGTALLYGVVKTGFAEELLFRGLIAGSLARRLPVLWANVVQAAVFLVPHLLLLLVMPEIWWFLPLVFLGALFLGWARIASDSMLGPWLIHAALNVTTALSIAIRSAPQ